ncbi:MAG: ATP-binding cassette domain-containing protein [Myxococcota bacterium]
MIEAQGIEKRYEGVPVLRGASLKVEPGDCVVLTGDNGSGKTTLLHVLMGLRESDAGRVLWKERPLTARGTGAWRSARRSWGFLPQAVSLPPHARIAHLLRLHARLRGADLEEARRWLGRVGLAEVEGSRVGALSGGMRQRLALALVLFHQPELVVMDEPRSSLDPGWRTALVDWVCEVAGRGAGVLVTTQSREGWPSDAQHRRCERGQIVELAGGEGGAP